MANAITGRIYDIKATEAKEYNGKTYFERSIVVDATKRDPYTGEAKYPNFPALLFSGEDRCRELDGYAIGEVVTVTFNLQGTKYNDKQTGKEKIFNKVQAYKIERYVQPGQAPATPVQQATQQSMAIPPSPVQGGGNPDNDLPF